MGDLALNERNAGAERPRHGGPVVYGWSGSGRCPSRAPDLRRCSQLSVLRRRARTRNSFIRARPGCSGIEGVSLGDVTFDGRPPSLTIHRRRRRRLLCFLRARPLTQEPRRADNRLTAATQRNAAV